MGGRNLDRSATGDDRLDLRPETEEFDGFDIVEHLSSDINTAFYSLNPLALSPVLQLAYLCNNKYTHFERSRLVCAITNVKWNLRRDSTTGTMQDTASCLPSNQTASPMSIGEAHISCTSRRPVAIRSTSVPSKVSADVLP